MKKKILVAIIIFLATLVYLIPAKVLESIITTPSNVVISGISGSLWSGSVAQVVTPELSLSDVEYSLNPFALFTATLSVDLDFPKGDIRGDANLQLGSDYAKAIEVFDANLSMQASFLEKHLPVRGVRIAGDLSSEALFLFLQNKRIAALAGKLHWRGAQVSYAGANWQLGDFSVLTETNEKTKTISAEILKTKNSLDLQGKATLTTDGMFEFVGSVSTETDQQIFNMLSMFKNGNVEGGRLPIKYRQKVL